MMYGIMVTNTGMWGCTTWCKCNGKVELYRTREEAERKAEEYNKQQGPVNRYNEYWAEEYR